MDVSPQNDCEHKENDRRLKEQFICGINNDVITELYVS